MVLKILKLKTFFYFYVFILFKSFSCFLVFPFKTILGNNFDNINSDSQEYNSTHYLKNNFNKVIYTTIKIGEPPQEVNTIITYNDCNFKIGKARKCIYSSEYLSYYNHNLSKSFNYTDYYNYHLSEFEGNKGQSAEDIIYAYTDLNLKNFAKFENIGFYLGSDTNDSLCGIIGFKIENYATFCYESNNIIKSFKSKDIINNYEWILNYTSEEQGFLILGGDLKDLIPNYKKEKLYNISTIMGGSDFPWMIIISKIECGENNNTIIISKEVKAEINNDYSLIVGGSSYENYIQNNFFNEYIKQNICSINLINYADNHKYYVYECDKEKFNKSNIDKFPKLAFTPRYYDNKFNFEGKDLFVETKYKYFFNIIFMFPWGDNYWIFGKKFLQKFPTMINFKSKFIQIYNDDNREESIINNNNYNNKLSRKYIILMILLILVLLCIFSTLFYFLGKNLNKLRKKKANEFDDGYDYTSAEEKNAINM